MNPHKQKQHTDDPNLSSSDGDYIEDDIDPSDDTEKQYTQQREPQVKSILLTPWCNMTDEELINTNATLKNPTGRNNEGQNQSPEKNNG